MPRENNQFGSPNFVEEKILDAAGALVGTVRIKPSGILWKPTGQQKYYRVDLEAFREWITDDETGATRVSH